MRTLILGFMGLALLAGPAAAASQSTPPQSRENVAPGQCFYSRDITSWRSAGNTGVNLVVNNRDVYHLDLLNPCPRLGFTGEAIGVKTRAGGDQICTGLDVDVLVPQGRGQLPIYCPVAKITPLTPAEVKALPKREQP